MNSSQNIDKEKSEKDLIEKCSSVIDLGGHKALRLSCLKKSLEEKHTGDLPQIEVFYQTLYKKYKMKTLSK